MKYLSVCSGIEAASVAWHHMGWEPLAFSEIEAFPRAVLAHHYPNVPIHGDFTHLRDHMWIEDADVLVGGTPCQAFSVAGLRRSLDDDRGNLSLEFVRLADAIDDLRSTRGRAPAIILWENVPGVLSVKDNAFGCFLAALAGDVAPYVPPRGKWTDAGVVAGPQRTVAWRILDAQYFGLAQRRRRVFVVASAREGFDPAEVLFEREGVRRDTAPRREAGQRTAPTVTSGPPFSRTGNDRTEAEALITNGSHWDGPEYPHPTLNQSRNTGGVGQSNQELFSQRGAYLAAAGYMVPVAFHPTQDPISSTDGSTHALGCGSSQGQASIAVAFPINTQLGLRGAETSNTSREGIGIGNEGDPSFTLQAGHGHAVAFSIMPMNSGKDYKARETDIAQPLMTNPVGGNQGGDYVAQSMAVRRLTPKECERLQGFPDDYTAIPGAADGPRYKALGNSMAVPVMHWIGERIQKKVLVTPSES